jgi:hypothetical protein
MPIRVALAKVAKASTEVIVVHRPILVCVVVIRLCGLSTIAVIVGVFTFMFLYVHPKLRQ